MKFDLSALQKPDPTPEALRPPPIDFTFSFGASFQPTVGLVRRFAEPAPVPSVEIDTKKCERGDDEEHDQYAVRSDQSLCWAVLCKNDTGRLHPRSLLGDYGHAERLTAWTHLVGAVVYVIYAILRPTVITREHTTEETLATAATWASAFCFAASAVYHVTAPSERVSFFTRQLDYFGIYLAVATGAVADTAIATRGFLNTHLLSILDVPLAAVLVALFFLVRRASTPSSSTWASYMGECTLGLGLLRRGHADGAHTGARQATSFVVAVAYFVTIPSIFSNFGTAQASIIVGIEVLAFVVVVLGMSLDNAVVWPDTTLAAGKGPQCLASRRCGCALTSHALWHLFALVAAAKASAAREFALSLSR